MAVNQENRKYAVKVEYKPEFDLDGELNLPSYSQTFSKVKESATTEQLKAFADALMSLTIYRDAPYKVSLIDTTELIVDDGE